MPEMVTREQAMRRDERCDLVATSHNGLAERDQDREDARRTETSPGSAEKSENVWMTWGVPLIVLASHEPPSWASPQGRALV